MVIDDFVGKFRLVMQFGTGDDWMQAECPWCPWQYELPTDTEMAVVLATLGQHMTAEHRG